MSSLIRQIIGFVAVSVIDKLTLPWISLVEIEAGVVISPVGGWTVGCSLIGFLLDSTLVSEIWNISFACMVSSIDSCDFGGRKVPLSSPDTCSVSKLPLICDRGTRSFLSSCRPDFSFFGLVWGSACCAF